MKVALISTFSLPTAPFNTGAVPSLVYNLANELGKKGHEVDVYATRDSDSSGSFNLIPIIDKSLWLDTRIKDDIARVEAERMLASIDALKIVLSKNYDIIHIHRWYFLQFAALFPSEMLHKIITTHHSPLTDPMLQLLIKKYNQVHHVFISEYQRKHSPETQNSSIIYNGIDLDLFPYSKSPPEKRDYMFFLGRIVRDKGAMEALDVAVRSGKRLIAAGVMDPNEIDYFNTFKTKANSALTSLVGEVNKDVRMNYLQNARLMLMPIMGEEAFGLMFIEAMASGTPIVSFARGSTLEIIKDGITGFLVNPSNSDIRGDFIVKATGIEGIIEAVQRLYSLSNEEFHIMSQACRKEVENRFTLTKMVNDYEKLYQKLLTQ